MVDPKHADRKLDDQLNAYVEADEDAKNSLRECLLRGVPLDAPLAAYANRDPVLLAVGFDLLPVLRRAPAALLDALKAHAYRHPTGAPSLQAEPGAQIARHPLLLALAGAITSTDVGAVCALMSAGGEATEWKSVDAFVTSMLEQRQGQGIGRRARQWLPDRGAGQAS